MHGTGEDSGRARNFTFMVASPYLILAIGIVCSYRALIMVSTVAVSDKGSSREQLNDLVASFCLFV